MHFSDVIGQDQAKKFMIESLKSGKFAHAQIIAGNCGYGGLTLAMAAASYLFCQNRENDSCGSCPECGRTYTMQHPDFLVVFPVGSDSASSSDKITSSDFMSEFRDLVQQTQGYFTFEQFKTCINLEKKQAQIRVAEAESLLRTINLSTFEGGWRVILVYLPEKMNPETANKLLKVIEEPPSKNLFLFVSEQYGAILPTIRSRCQLLRLAPLSQEEISEALIRKKGVDKEKAGSISRISQGSWCRALEILTGDAIKQEYHDLFVTLMRICWRGDYIEIFDWSSEASGLGREHLSRFADYSIQMLRDSYMESLGESELNFSYADDRTFISKFAPFVNEKTVEPLVNEFTIMKRDIVMNGNANIVLSHFALSVSKIFSLSKQAR